MAQLRRHLGQFRLRRRELPSLWWLQRSSSCEEAWVWVSASVVSPV